MTVTVERNGPVTTIVHARPEARNAVDPARACSLLGAFRAFQADPGPQGAGLWGAGGAFCAGADLKAAAAAPARPLPLKSLDFPADGGAPPRGPMGPTRLELSKPV